MPPSNFGPDRIAALDLGQTHTVWVPAGGRARFRFSFSAFNENASLIYTEDTLDPVVYRNNLYTRTEDWETTNHERHPKGFVMTGWHKNERYAEYEPTPWYQSRAKVFFSDATKASVGFEDIATDADFDDALITVNIFPPPWPARPFIVPGDATFTARHVLAFVFGAMAGGIAGLLFQEAVRTWWTGLRRREP
jgi:hypothetical protein